MTRRTYQKMVGAIVVAVAVWLLTSGVAQTTDELVNPPPGEWPTYGRTLDMWRYSPLDQINRDNVDQLRLVWSRDLGTLGRNQTSPVVVDGVMYINGIDNQVLALDATNGDLIWTYAAELDENIVERYAVRMRGSVVVYDGKVFYNRRDGVTVALDAETGEEVWSTSVTDPELAEGFTAGPIFADGKLIAGTAGADVGGIPGKVVAFDAQNGEVLWTFNTIPGPGDPGYETWVPSESAEWGGGAAWTPGAYDPETRTVIYGVGQPTPWDNFTVRGEPSPDLYTTSWVGLDVDTGELKWYFQTTPGDEWDYDAHPTPVVADLEIDGQMKRTAILASPAGYIILVDVETGEFLRSHAMHPEYTVHMGFEADGTPIINADARFTEEGGTMDLCPFRWVNFEPPAYSPDTGLYYRPNWYNCYDYTLYALPDDWQPGERPLNFELVYQPDQFERAGAVSAIDPVTGEVVWEFAHGYRHLAGVAATGGGLVFGGFPDRVFRAFDAETGELLWQQVLTSGMESSPMTYEVNGTQYVAVIAGTDRRYESNSDLPETVIGSSNVFVFALPEGEQ